MFFLFAPQIATQDGHQPVGTEHMSPIEVKNRMTSQLPLEGQTLVPRKSTDHEWMPLLFDGFDDHGWNRVSHLLTHSDRTESTSQPVGMSIKRVFFFFFLRVVQTNCPYNIGGGVRQCKCMPTLSD